MRSYFHEYERETLLERLHHVLEYLIEKDPTASTPEGRLLIRLAEAAEEYEKNFFFVKDKADAENLP